MALYKIIDSHHHLWTLDHKDWYPWLTADLVPLYRDYTLADYVQEISFLQDSADVVGSVLVQASPSEEEIDLMVRIADNSKGIVRGVVGWVNMLDTHSCIRTIDHWMKHLSSCRILDQQPRSLLVGLRPMLQDLPDDEWMLRHISPALISHMVDIDICFDALIKPSHLTHLKAFVGKYPLLKIVIDHAAKPTIMGMHPLSDHELANTQWAKDMKWLASNSNVLCKISGLFTEIHKATIPPMYKDDIQYQTNLIKPYIKFLIEIFTCKRLMWGSDWPVLEVAGIKPSMWIQCCIQIFNELGKSIEDQQQIFYHNAIRFYKL
ncbi:hypothetical protein CYY_007742 [Polysphondylium violaceum]|uniref:Amidohydrolase-related domain-containing protein n=1 Tax=Polysphondylium violaceum TaxID=133409 RepID=A0A8J4UQN8_9MYCE|nr:hypothetical protein CYY_007742 [Polysphondylium violaceum]